MQDNLTNTQK